jgi:hypothetical protein
MAARCVRCGAPDITGGQAGPVLCAICTSQATIAPPRAEIPHGTTLVDALRPFGLPAAIAGRYRLETLIGSGTMGLVLRARDTQLGRVVAIKFLTLVDNDEAIKRFAREGRALAAVSHPAVVPLFDLGEEGRIPYLVMEHLAGGSLDGYLRTVRARHRPDPRDPGRIAGMP